MKTLNLTNNRLLRSCRSVPQRLLMPALLGLWITAIPALAQPGCGEFQNSAWTFGSNAGVTFNPFTGVLAGVSNLPKINTFEGSASVSDASGSFMFYTDGTTVWNGNHTVMVDNNGVAVTGATNGLKGDRSSTQAALIVPCGCGNKYFIFTTDSSEMYHSGVGKGLNYSVVSWDSVKQKWFLSKKNILLMPEAAEKLASTAVDKSWPMAFWVVTHDLANHFVTWKTQATPLSDGTLDCAVLKAGVTQEATNYGGPSAANGWAAGQMKLSSNGKYLAVTRASFKLNPTSAPEDHGFVDLFAFNRATGAVGGLLTGNFPSGPYTTKPWTSIAQDGAYGVEFSSDSTKLYVSATKVNNVLNQYSIKAGLFGIVSVGSPLTLLTGQNPGTYDFGQLQIAPGVDPPTNMYGDIFMSRSSGKSLVRISSPNAPLPGVNPTGLNLAPNAYSLLGLPNFVTWY